MHFYISYFFPWIHVVHISILCSPYKPSKHHLFGIIHAIRECWKQSDFILCFAPLALSVVNARCEASTDSWLVYCSLGSSALAPNTAKFPAAVPPLTQQPAVHSELGIVMTGTWERSSSASLDALLGFLAIKWSVCGIQWTNELPVKRYKVPSSLVQ